MRYTILIADDEKISLHLMEKYLSMEEDKFIVHRVYDGKQALNIARIVAFDTIILDWNLPLMDSDSMLLALKSNSINRNTPVIITSSTMTEEDMEIAFDLGIQDFIRKPIKRVELKIRINIALKHSRILKDNEYQRNIIDTNIDELNKLSLIIKETDNSVVLVNTDGEMEWANEGFARMYGIKYENFIDRYGTNLKKTSFNIDVFIQKLEQVIENEKSTNYISHIQNFNTIKEKWVQTTLTPIFGNGGIDKIVAIETDITKEKISEQHLRQKNEDMQQLTEELKKTNEELYRQKELIEEEREKTNKLLESILPHHIASQLKTIGSARTRKYKKSTIMFTDFKGFTKSCEHLNPDEIVSALDSYFSVFDEIVVNHFIEKIKTIGDAYMCVGGIPLRNRSNPFDVVIAGLKIQNYMNHLDKFDPENKLPRWRIRMGIHTGPLVAGVVGKIKFAYDVWGDSVNVASRMETACEVGKVNISGATYKEIKDYFDCEYRGELEMKNRGKMAMYFVNGIKDEYTDTPDKTIPNDKFKKILHSL